MEISPRGAAGAYQALSRLGEGLNGRNTQRTGGGEGGDFAGMVRSAVQGLGDQLRQADRQTQAFAAGRAELVDVVTAVAETEVALETMVSVRDRMITAYEEIMRMPI